MPYWSVDQKWLNHIIRGKIEFRKCPNCDKDGIELQAYDMCGNPCDISEKDSLRDMCGDCQGLGFIELPS